MTPKLYRKRPVQVEAARLTTDYWWDVARWCDGETVGQNPHAVLKIETLEGTMTAYVGDYVIRGVEGEFYPCKPDIFHQTYEEVAE